MYSLYGYGRMLSEPIRMDAYLKALRQAVTPGCVVLDLGAGPGIFSLYACQWGARLVYAVEPGPSIQLAKELAAANGFGDRIVTIQDFSTKIDLPERADVLIADLRGILPFLHRGIESMIDARERLLAPGGALIPRRDTIWAALVETPEVYGGNILAWEQGGFNMSAARVKTANTIYKLRARPEQLLSEARELGAIDYRTVNTARFRSETQWQAARPGIAHGLCLWYDTVLGDGAGYSNAPGLPELIYGNAFLPFPEPVMIAAGDHVGATISADPVSDEYVWRWNTRFESAAGAPKAAFQQSTFFSTLITPESLRSKTLATCATPTPSGA